MVLSEGAKQIMITPETDHEKKCLEMIDPESELEIVTRWGSFTNEYEHAKLQVSECQGGNLRAFSDEDSLMFLIKDKNEN